MRCLMYPDFYVTSWIDVHKTGWPEYFQWSPPEGTGLVEFGHNGQRRFTTKQVIAERVRRNKIEKQNNNLRRKRCYYRHSSPAHIHVFFNDSVIYHGWWIYIETLMQNIPLNFRRNRQFPEIVAEAMRLFPCGCLPDTALFEIWAKEFCRTYQAPSAKRTQSGRVLCRAYFDEDAILTGISEYTFPEVSNG